MKKLYVPIFFAAFFLAATCCAFFDDFKNKGNNVMETNQSPMPSDDSGLEMTVVFDNNPYNRDLETSWGFACVIKGFKETILFDTGADGDILLKNMQAMNIDPKEIQTIVLSHMHWDHTGGLEKFLAENSDVTVFLLKSFPQEIKNIVISHGAILVKVEQSQQVCENVFATGKLGETIPEQSLILHTARGQIVITGCAHPGITEILRKVKTLSKEEICLVFGGFHLHSTSENELKNIVTNFRELNVRYAGPTHCSGDLARHYFLEAFKENYLNIGVGRVIRLADL